MYLHNLLASERATWALTQSEVGALLGLSEDTIGNYELSERRPSLFAALGLGIVFGTSLPRLFPDVMHAVAAEMLPNAQRLSIAIEHETDTPAKLRKQVLLTALADRLAVILPDA